jgi:hypothetical protein
MLGVLGLILPVFTLPATLIAVMVWAVELVLSRSLGVRCSNLLQRRFLDMNSSRRRGSRMGPPIAS